MRWRVYPVALLFLLLALALLGSVSTTHLTCEPTLTLGRCTVTRYALFTGFREVEVRASDLIDLDVQIRTGSKGGRYAVATLLTREQPIALSGSLLTRLEPTSALEARSRYQAWTKAPGTGLDVWLAPSILSNIAMAIGGALIFAFALAILREHIAQHWPVVIDVDHERGLVRVGGRVVRIDEIESVEVEDGRALFWGSGKNEHIPGFRIVVSTRGGSSIAATKEFRAGSRGVHERARERLLSSIGHAS